MRDIGNSTLTYSSVTNTPTTTLEPTAVLGLLSIGTMGLFTKRKKAGK